MKWTTASERGERDDPEVVEQQPEAELRERHGEVDRVSAGPVGVLEDERRCREPGPRMLAARAEGITIDAGRCQLPGLSSLYKDFRVTFVCNGEPYFYMVAADLRFHVNVGGVTQRIMGEMGIHFVMVSSTGNPLAGGTTPTNQVYPINLFKRPAQQVPGLANCFAARGIPHNPRGCAPGVC